MAATGVLKDKLSHMRTKTKNNSTHPHPQRQARIEPSCTGTEGSPGLLSEILRLRLELTHAFEVLGYLMTPRTHEIFRIFWLWKALASERLVASSQAKALGFLRLARAPVLKTRPWHPKLTATGALESAKKGPEAFRQILPSVL